MTDHTSAPLDAVDRRILARLQGQGRLSNVDLAQEIGLSESPTFRRVKHLEQSGVIQHYSAVIDQRQLGFDVTAFVQVNMEKQPDSATQAFHRAVAEEPHIIECHAMSGGFDYLMKVVARSIDHFSEICMMRILKFPGVRHVESNFSLQEIKHGGSLPISP